MPRLLFALVAVAAALPAGEPPAPKSPTDAEFSALCRRVQAKLDDLRGQADFPGVTVGFALADGRSAGVSSGLADVEAKTPLKPTDRMLAGSVGKTFVAAVTLQLIQERVLGLDDKLERWLGKEAWFAACRTAAT